LLKVMSVMVEPIIATWSAPAAFARLGGIVLPYYYSIHGNCKKCHR
jgi:hypothetical protein